MSQETLPKSKKYTHALKLIYYQLLQNQITTVKPLAEQ